MQAIYIMDTEMSIPKNSSGIHTFEEVYEKAISELNTSYTSSVLDWAEMQFQKMFKMLNVQNKFDFDGVLIAFFQSYYFNTPEAFFNSEKNLLALKITPYNTGAESNIQKSAIH